MIEIDGSPYVYANSQQPTLDEISARVQELRRSGSLTNDVLHNLRKYFRIKNIYHSNAIEGNNLDAGETRQVVELGMTLTGKSLKDQAEAKNLGQATDFLENLVSKPDVPITEADIRQIHHLVLKGIDDDNAGSYRSIQVEISGSDFTPPGPESVPAKMAELGKYLASATMPGSDFASARGVLAAAVAHTWFVHIHPFVDGNGRVARLLMNLLLMRYGVPIAIISRNDRMRYYDTLEQAQSSDLSGVVALLCECIHESLEEYEHAAEEQREHAAWTKQIAQQFGSKEETKAKNQYEVWRSAMDLLMSYMRQTAETISESTPTAQIYFKAFGHLEIDKYIALKHARSAKRTWFFRLDFRSGERSARYLFYFGYPSLALRPTCDVTLWISREDPEGSYFYVRLDSLTAPNVPAIREVGYNAKKECFASRKHTDDKFEGRIEKIGKAFYEDIIEKHFSS